METYYFVEELPLALEYGMSPHQFWEEDIDLFYAYQKAYVNRVHNQAHLIGLYNELAFSVTMANAFRNKNSDVVPYPKEDVYNPLKTKAKDKEKTFIESLDTTENNNQLYNIKKILEERRKNK